MNRQHALIKGLVLSAAVVAVPIVLLSANSAMANYTPASEVIDQLGRAMVARDALPDSVPVEDFGSNGLRSETSRLIGTDGKRSFWVAVDNGDNLCFIVSLGDVNHTIGSACNRPDRIAAAGQTLGLQGEDGVTYVAVLLPDSARESDIGGDWKLVGRNVAISLADDNAVPLHVSLEGQSDATIELRRN